jgi:two-component system, cell cycle response regulator
LKDSAISSIRGSVLVVDDDASTRLLVSRWLAKEGFAVFEAPSGESALQLLSAPERGLQPFDCMVLDVMMPGMTGLEVLARVRASGASESLPILMLTAHATGDEEVVRAMEEGASDYIFKPFSGPVLVARVRALATRAREARTLQMRLQEAEASATIDPLTTLFNRRHLDKALIEEAARARRHHARCAVLLCDIDHFKAVNDTHGHAEGDRALQYFGTKMQSVLRGEDRAFRYGGEEFLLLLPGADAEGASRVAERLRSAMNVEPFEIERTREALRLTFSGGVAVLGEASDYAFRGVVEAADKALYEAKKSGRNCIKIGTLVL